ncbi:MAG: hypothetical protein OEO21_04855 [Candidatus Krumholzibacteria bacterium]|nr:hypothetical protein [Candidatus Krumholzibacteria bacterium]
MKTVLWTALTVVLGMSGAAYGQAKVDLGAMKLLTERYPMAIQVGTPGAEGHRFVYTNSAARLHVHRVKDGKLVKDWETSDLGSRAASMFVTDLYGDGVLKLVVGTIRGRVLIYDFDSYSLEWENLQYRYAALEYLLPANLDNDPQQEIIVIADKIMAIFDGLNKNIQWLSDTQYTARHVIVGNVDDDPQLEIILNTGRVVDSRFYTIEYEADQVFGDRISLFDVTGDGYPEVFGENIDFSIKVFDIWAQRELW